MDPNYHGHSYYSDEEEEENLVIDEDVDLDNQDGRQAAAIIVVKPESVESVKEKTSTRDYLQMDDSAQTTETVIKKHPIKSLEMVVNNIMDRNFKQEKIESTLKSPAMMTGDKNKLSQVSSTSLPEVKVEPTSVDNDNVVCRSPTKEDSSQVKQMKEEPVDTIQTSTTEEQNNMAKKELMNATNTTNSQQQPIVSESQPAKKSDIPIVSTTSSRNLSLHHQQQAPVVSSYSQLSHPYPLMNTHTTSLTSMTTAGLMARQSNTNNSNNSSGMVQQHYNGMYGSPYDFSAAGIAGQYAHGFNRQKISPTQSKGESPSPVSSTSVPKATQSRHLTTGHRGHHSNSQSTPSKKYSSEDKENSPLDLSVGFGKKPENTPKKEEVPLRKAEKRSPVEAPMDLAPKRIKTEMPKMQTTPLKTTPLRPTPVTQPNWYSDCLSKLASSVNQKNGLDSSQKTSTSSAFKPITPQMNSRNNLKNCSSQAMPLPMQTPYGMLPNPWSMGLSMDPSSLAMMSMMNPFMMGGGALPSMMPTGLSTFKESVRSEVKALKRELSEICKKMDTASTLSKLSAHFHYEVDRLENECMKVASSHLGGVEKDSLSAYYDNQIYMIVCSVKTQLQLEKKTLELGSKLKADTSSDNLLTVPNTIVPDVMRKTSPIQYDSTKITPPNSTRFHNFSLDQGASPMHMSTPRSLSSPVCSEIGANNSSSIKSPNNSGDSSNESGFLDSSDISPNDQGYGSAQKRRFLSTSAIQILGEWYSEHLDHPYPDEEDVEELAKKASISECQVKKWMANKRVRSSNTLSFNGSIHPKKLQKLLQIKEATVDAPTASTATTTAASASGVAATEVPAMPETVVKSEPQPSIPTSVASQYGGLLNQVQVSNGQVTYTNGEKSIVIPHKPPRKQKTKRLLDPKAVEAMNTWYFNHIEYPYPTDDEKQQIADDNQLSVAQVTCWFANKRNRSNNTRKMTPKMRKSEPSPFVTGHMMASPQLPLGFMNPSSISGLGGLSSMASLSGMPAFPTMLSQPSH